jgi:hypothetical protein
MPAGYKTLKENLDRVSGRRYFFFLNEMKHKGLRLLLEK